MTTSPDGPKQNGGSVVMGLIVIAAAGYLIWNCIKLLTL